jgi:hypothetical protein
MELTGPHVMSLDVNVLPKNNSNKHLYLIKMFPTQFALCVTIDQQRLPQPQGKTNQNGLFDITYIYIMITLSLPRLLRDLAVYMSNTAGVL